ncbi:Hypothetical protein HDN1F_23020 [gamma proteobacterium HdN1]|nr:Hypothetical protein HDN1F_23020 [gamma proteobacterium HdN1]
MARVLPSVKSYRDWHVPWQWGDVSLREGLAYLATLAARAEEIPLLVRLIENPRYRIPGVTLFHGAVDLRQHDCIHLLLGRGLLSKDEAFVIGFTMGSTGEVSSVEESVFCKIARHLYPRIYRFDQEDESIFRDAVKLGAISRCEPLDRADFRPLLDVSLDEARRVLGIERELIEAYYRVEQRRFPEDRTSARLI